MLVNFLLEVLVASRNAGLEVVVTSFDMGDNSVKALKHMGLSEKTPFIRFQNQEITAIFDPPHPLKFTHNIFLKHDVADVEYVLLGMASDLLVLLSGRYIEGV